MKHIINALIAIFVFYGKLGASSPSLHGSYEPKVQEDVQRKFRN